jgi:hypothetical protein
MYRPFRQQGHDCGNLLGVSTASRALPGLPSYGPPPVQFSATGQSKHREGFVVEFNYENGPWIGNFQRGTTGFDIVLEHPDGRSVIVIAGGAGYVIDPGAQNATSMFGGTVAGLIDTRSGQVVFSTSTEFEAYGPAGLNWRTRRLSWDGFRSVRVEGDNLKGEGWTFDGNMWIEFSVQLATGEATGGACPQTNCR